MLVYIEKNVNPKKRKTGDCSTRALTTVLGLPYEEVLKLQMEEALKCYYDITSKQVVERILNKFGYIKIKMPKHEDGTRVKVKELDSLLSYSTLDRGVLVTVANHHTAVIGRNIIDIWDCGNKSIGNYYIKVT